MNKYRYLLGNSFLFAVGNLGSKLIALVLVPLYTFTLSTDQYGTVDLLITTVNLLIPVISLSIFDATMRFVLDKKGNENFILSNGVFVTIIGTFVFALLVPLISLLNIPNVFLVYLILVSQAFQSLFSEFARALERLKLFAFNGLFGALVLGISNIIFLVFFHFAIFGYLLSMLISAIASVSLLAWRLHIWNRISLKMISKVQVKKMLTYSIPLIPNALAWWITNASNRYFILLFVGASANGLFAVANKIPSILNMINNIFFQSWQLSAVEEFKSRDKEKFYSSVFNYYSVISFGGASLLFTVLLPVLTYAVSTNFYNSWKLIPFLTISVIYAGFSSFIGANYIAAKITTGIMTTTIMGALLNVILCLLVVPLWGANGAGFASAISFFSIWLIRLHDTRKFIRVRVELRHFIPNNAILLIQILFLYLHLNLWIIMLLEAGLFCLFCLLNCHAILVSVKQLRQKS